MEETKALMQKDESLPFRLMDALDDYPPIIDAKNNDAYVAGIVDGEGTIYINKRKPRNENSSPSYCLFVAIHNSYKPLLEWVKLIYGGSVYKTPSPKEHRQMWMWVVSNKKAHLFLHKILGYLLIKEKQAIKAIEFYESDIKNWGKKKIPQEILEKREYYRQLISNLNQGR